MGSVPLLGGCHLKEKGGKIGKAIKGDREDDTL